MGHYKEEEESGPMTDRGSRGGEDGCSEGGCSHQGGQGLEFSAGVCLPSVRTAVCLCGPAAC